MKLYSVLVTGANRGIGLEFVKQLVTSQDAPEFVFATYRNRDTRQDLKAIREDSSTKSTLYLIKLDVTKKSDIEGAKKIIEDMVGHRGLTLLINNAGVSDVQPFPHVKEENLNTHFAINTAGPLMVFQTMLPLLQKAVSTSAEPGMSFSKAGVLNISSMAGSIERTGKLLLFDLSELGYKISKAALNMAMRIAAAKVKEDSILVVNMCPGGVWTDMSPEEDMLEAQKEVEIQMPEVSISRMLAAMAKMNEANHGTFVSNFGEVYPF